MCVYRVTAPSEDKQMPSIFFLTPDEPVGRAWAVICTRFGSNYSTNGFKYRSLRQRAAATLLWPVGPDSRGSSRVPPASSCPELMAPLDIAWLPSLILYVAVCLCNIWKHQPDGAAWSHVAVLGPATALKHIRDTMKRHNQML